MNYRELDKKAKQLDENLVTTTWDEDILSQNSDGSYNTIIGTVTEVSGSGYSSDGRYHPDDSYYSTEIKTSEIQAGTATIVMGNIGNVGLIFPPILSKYMDEVTQVQCKLCGKLMNKENANAHLKKYHAELWLEEKLINDIEDNDAKN